MRRLSWIALSALLAGCAVSQPAVPVRAYLGGDFGAVRAFAEQEVLEGAEENLALVLNVQGQCELYLGDDDAARKTLLRAARRPRAHDLRGAQARHPDGRRGRG